MHSERRQRHYLTDAEIRATFRALGIESDEERASVLARLLPRVSAEDEPDFISILDTVSEHELQERDDG